MIAIVYVALFLPTTSPYSYLPKHTSDNPSYNNQAQSKDIINSSEIPYHVLIVYSNLYCSGALTSSRLVVTAASCILRQNNDNVIVKVGSDTITGEGQIIPVIEVKIHEYYKHRSAFDNDIALMILQKDVNFSKNVKKIILVEPDVAVRTDTVIKVSGWGSNNLPSKYVNRLIQTEMYVTTKTECEMHYGRTLTSSMYCATYLPERRLSDNGGPAVYDIFLVGIISFGANNKEAPHVAVFTNISYFHRWLRLNTMRFLKKYCTITDKEISYNDTYEYYHDGV